MSTKSVSELNDEILLETLGRDVFRAIRTGNPRLAKIAGKMEAEFQRRLDALRKAKKQ